MNRICTICARGGSKGVKNKNIRMICGKPLLAHSILQARDTHLFQGIAVSSDSAEILDVAKAFGVDFLIERPPELASDTAAKIPAIQHCVRSVEELTGFRYDIIVDLDATSPLRIPDDISGSVGLLEESDTSNVITGARARRSPYFNLVELDERGIVHLSKTLERPLVRRQDAPTCYDMNASIYVWKNDALFSGTSLFLNDTRLFEMPEERSIDIDSELDFRIVELLMTGQEKKW